MITHWRVFNDDSHVDDDDDGYGDHDIDLQDKQDGAKDDIEGGNAGRVVNTLVAPFNFYLEYCKYQYSLVNVLSLIFQPRYLIKF